MIEVAGKKPEPKGVIIHGECSQDWRENVREIIYPVRADDCGYIWDAEDKMIAQVRGWGALTSSGISDFEAIAIQDTRAKLIVDALNAVAAERAGEGD